MSERIPDAEIDLIADRILGTALSIPVVVELLELDEYDPSEVEDRLLDVNVEPCPGCGWWFNSHDLVEQDDGSFACSDCSTVKDD